MSTRERGQDPVHDVVGIGFGPANLALAIAVEEHNAAARSSDRVDAVFLERQPEFRWHRGMLIDGTVMQVSFLKDLATMRNPASAFGFVSYLHHRGRLVDFINHKTLFPTRVEFHDYLTWAAEKMRHAVRYGQEVVAVRSAGNHLEVDTRDGTVRARNVVFGVGLSPVLPAGVERSGRVWHSSELLHRAPDLADPRRLVVVGAGQSAAECTDYLHSTFPDAEVCSVFTRYGYSPADDSPFANRIFDPGAVGEFFHAEDDVKARLMDYHRNTNYAVVDLELIEELYRKEYQEKVTGRPRLRMLGATAVTGVAETAGHVAVRVRSLLDGTPRVLTADAVVFATGYEPADIRPLLGDLDRHCVRDERGLPVVARDYRMRTDAAVHCGLYLQGGTEHSHGITSSLLSNVAVRGGEILSSVLHRRAAVPTLLAA
ncbi:lysine N(6)-hydroxylase/L-ornithine N(5)-oxygenase family protein [Actinophytocola algeriensis]|uniref:L-lysine N6-monooxygenase MbtG n=1 Tax=Actinophytocola algeriensis TaxID=1768010 RepID=A0A7W7Q1I1_9PSEU|nr:SidA/IucD/PvdA family monooxygenase [Actinophytocola algeriensis]MBB4905108.1 L-ornithine N5-oxygenase [Actinophytocola algeriensis]MBE1473207.1 L-ornithine N5-oxygenase [Actinophytocola algeriensis]